MGIIGCAPTPIRAEFQYPVVSTNDTIVGIPSNFPFSLSLFTTDSLAWKKFTPTFAGMSLGSDIFNFSKYRLVRNHYSPEGAFLDVMWKLRFGNLATFSATAWETSLPSGMSPFDYTTAMSSKLPRVGQWLARDDSANLYYEGPLFLGASPSATPVRFAEGDDAGAVNNQITSTVPFTWTGLDSLTAVARMRVTVP